VWNAGRPIASRPGLPIYNRTDRGYRTSAFHCQFLGLNKGAVEDYKFPQGDTIPFILFLSDYPARMHAYTRYNDVGWASGSALPINVIDLNEDSALAGDVQAAPYTSVITATAAQTQMGGLTRGVTPTNGVSIFGYVGHVATRTSNYETNEQGTKCEAYLWMDATACGPVIDNAVSSGGQLAFDPGAQPLPFVTCTILAEPDYTAAMKANNDQFTDANGVVVQIVGLHAQPIEF